MFIAVLCALATLVLGFVLGWLFAKGQHLKNRGFVVQQTIAVAREIMYNEMQSEEFHAAVMAVVHPDADCSEGFNPPQKLENDADRWLAMQIKPKPNRFRRKPVNNKHKYGLFT